MEYDAYKEMIELQEQHWWFVGRRHIIGSFANKYLPNSFGKVLEVGCGVGGNVNVLGGFGEYLGLDIHAPAIEYCKKSFPGSTFLNSSIEETFQTLITEKFTSIFMLDVLEHLDKDTESLAVVGQLLAEKGKVLITVPAFQFLWSSHDDFVHHKRRYTKKSLTKSINDAGLTIDYVGYFNSFLFPLAIVQRFTYKIFSITSKSHIKLPPKLLNMVMQHIFSFESRILDKVPFPVGLSIFAVCHKEES